MSKTNITLFDVNCFLAKTNRVVEVENHRPDNQPTTRREDKSTNKEEKGQDKPLENNNSTTYKTSLLKKKTKLKKCRAVRQLTAEQSIILQRNIAEYNNLVRMHCSKQEKRCITTFSTTKKQRCSLIRNIQQYNGLRNMEKKN